MKKAVLFVALAAFMLAACGKTKDDGGAERDAQDYNVRKSQPGGRPYIVDFSATWCGPCQQLKPYFHQMEEKYKEQAQFRTVDIDENEELARKHNITGVPTVIIFSDSTMNRELRRITGFDPEGIEDAIAEFI